MEEEQATALQEQRRGRGGRAAFTSKQNSHRGLGSKGRRWDRGQNRASARLYEQKHNHSVKLQNLLTHITSSAKCVQNTLDRPRVGDGHSVSSKGAGQTQRCVDIGEPQGGSGPGPALLPGTKRGWRLYGRVQASLPGSLCHSVLPLHFRVKHF